MTAAEQYQAIKTALANGCPELADAIEADRKCSDCGGYVSDDWMTVDPDKCCFYCRGD